MRLHVVTVSAILPALLSVGSAAAAAATATAEPAGAELFDSAYFMQVIGALLLVFGCLFGLAFVMKKLNGVPVGDRKSLRIVSSVKVGAREKILLMDTGENLLLVGVAAGNIRTLYVYEGDGVADTAEAEAGRPAGANFAALMSGANPTGAGA